MSAMERDGSTPKGYELHVHAGDDPTPEIKAMVKALNVEDGDVLLVRLAPGIKYRDLERAHHVMRSVFKSIGVQAVALTAPADFDIERIAADKIPGLIELLQGLLERGKAARGITDDALQAADAVEADEDDKAEPSNPAVRGVRFEATRGRNAPIQPGKRGGGIRRGGRVAG